MKGYKPKKRNVELLKKYIKKQEKDGTANDKHRHDSERRDR